MAILTPGSDTASTAATDVVAGEQRSLSPLSRVLRNRRVQVSGSVILLVILVAAFGPLLPNYDPYSVGAGTMLSGPTARNWLGGDHLGRDILSRLILGTRISLQVALISCIIAASFGITLGLVAGYYSGIMDALIMRMMDILLSFPAILLGIAVVAFLGNGFVNLIGVIAVVYAPKFARVAYGVTQSLKNNDYVLAARAAGAGDGRILATAILPNMMAPMIVQFSLTIGLAILVESGLSFLGLGAVPPTPTWGNMIAAAADFLDSDPLMALWPSLALGSVVFFFNTLGDGLRDALDPRLKE